MAADLGYSVMESPLSDDTLLDSTDLVTERGYVPSPRNRMERRSSIDTLDPTALRVLRRNRMRRSSNARRPDLLLPMSVGRGRRKSCRFCRKVMRSRQAKRWLAMGCAVFLGACLVVTVLYVVQKHGDAPSSTSYKVHTPLGPVQGFTDGKSVMFLGIPYAQPPVGPLRWKPPLPPKPWTNGLVSGMYPGPACPQDAAWGYNITQWDEDCLFVSIYSPFGARLEVSTNTSANTGTLRPVAVFLHGGGFITGSGQQHMYNGSDFAKATGVVVVTVNYRLGAFGFAALPELTAEQGTSGNYGLLDQQRALAFVRQVIYSFGGDPSRVTLWGQGAGGASALLHLTFAGSAPYFNQVASESGPIDASLPSLESVYNASLKLAADLNCTTPTGGAELECLRKANRDAVVSASWHASLRPKWMPVLDGVYFSTTADAAITSGSANKTVDAVLLGSNSNDATAILYFLLGDIRTGVTPTIARLLMHQWFRSPDIVTQVWNRYGHTFSSVNFTGNFGALAQVVSDGAYHCRVFALSRYLARANVPAYAYKFVHHLSFSSPLFESAHFMELPFLWNKPCFVDCSYQRGTFTPWELDLIPRLQGRWSQFMSGNAPNIPGLPASVSHTGAGTGNHTLASWPAVASGGGGGAYLRLAATAGKPVVSFAEEGVCEFWAGLGDPFGDELWLFD